MAKRILVVDDEQPIVDLISGALVEAGYEVDGANSGQQALQLVKDNLYDVAILDFALPDTNGVMLHHELRKVDAELAERTLFISGAEQSRDHVDYFSSDGGGYFAKPFNIWEIVAAVRRLIAAATAAD